MAASVVWLPARDVLSILSPAPVLYKLVATGWPEFGAKTYGTRRKEVFGLATATALGRLSLLEEVVSRRPDHATIKPQPSLGQPTPCISCMGMFSSRPPQWLQQLGHWRSPKGVRLAHAQYAGPAGRVAAAAAAGGGAALLPIGAGLGGAAAAASTRGSPWRGALKRPFLAAGVGCRGGATASATRVPSPTCPGALKPELALETLPVLERLSPCRAPPRPEAEPRAGGATGGAGRLAAARPGRPVRTLSAAVWKAGLAVFCRAPAPAAPASASGSGSSASPKSQACWRLSIAAFAGLARLMSTPCPVWKPPPPAVAKPDCIADAAPKPTAPSAAEPKPAASAAGPNPMPPAVAKPDCIADAAPKPTAPSAADPKPTSAAGPKLMPPVSAEGSIGTTSR